MVSGAQEVLFKNSCLHMLSTGVGHCYSTSITWNYAYMHLCMLPNGFPVLLDTLLCSPLFQMLEAHKVFNKHLVDL
jgi:hypothetical protein